ncbi:MAG TPA: SRPBCC family protein [Nocardioidaceae bacterium]|nr:SRPBCC family protein [Nocardioidaceae bacterium]
MVTFVIERTISAPQDEVFAWLNDSSNYTAAPLCLREKRTRDGVDAPYGKGAMREVTGAGAWFREEITSFDPPREFGYLIHKSFPTIEHKGGAIRVEPVPGGSHVTWTTEFTVPLRGGGKAFERLAGPLLRTAFGQILAACDKQLAGSRR